MAITPPTKPVLLMLPCVLQEGQGRPHLFCDMRIVDDQGRPQPNDGKAVGHLQVISGCVGVGWLDERVQAFKRDAQSCFTLGAMLSQIRLITFYIYTGLLACCVAARMLPLASAAQDCLLCSRPLCRRAPQLLGPVPILCCEVHRHTHIPTLLSLIGVAVVWLLPPSCAHVHVRAGAWPHCAGALPQGRQALCGR